MPRATTIARATFGRLVVEVHPDQRQMIGAAAAFCVAQLRETIRRHGEARVAFDVGPSSREFFAALIACSSAAKLRWSATTVFQLTEIGEGSSGSGPTHHDLLQDELLSRVSVRAFHRLDPQSSPTNATWAAFDGLLRAQPLDLIYAELGESGTLAFNDPATADFADPALVKRVAPPRNALTLTLPVFRAARRLAITASGKARAPAVRATLHDPITTACPATLLRLHPGAALLLDPTSAALGFPSHTR